jgi:hypothetical protein
MHIRSLHWNLVAWDPSAGPADPYGAPRLAHAAWAVRAHWRAICLGAGAALMVTGLVLPSTVVFIAGVLAVGTSAGNARLPSATAARVRTWRWLDKSAAGHR